MSSPITNWTWNDPSVIKVGSQYWMYASATNNFSFPVRLYRLVSTDGATWTLNPGEPGAEILAVGTAGQFDAGGTETPSVVFFGGQYHLFWTGYADEVGRPGYSVYEFRIGHATSLDGVTWTKDATFIVGPTGASTDPPNLDFDQYVVGEPGPVVFNGKIYLYFTAIGADLSLNNTSQTIGVTTSSDGSTWSTPVQALAVDQSLYPRSANWVGYSTPNAAVINGQVHLFYDVANDHGNNTWQQERLHHAVSADGLTGWTQDSAPIRSMGDPSWTAAEIRSPAALLDSSTLRLYFAGTELTAYPYNLDIGMLTCNPAP